MRCSQCGLLQPAASYSKRQHASAKLARCRACVATDVQAEVSQAQERSSQLKDDIQARTAAFCSVCKRSISATCFSRTQLIQKTDATRRCLECASAATAISNHAALAIPSPEEAALPLPRACTAVVPLPYMELARYQACKRLRRRFYSLCLDIGGGAPPVMAFDRWVARCKLEREEAAMQAASAGSAFFFEPLLPVPDAAPRAAEGLIKDLRRTGVLSAEQAAKICSKLATVANKSLTALAAVEGDAEGGADVQVQERGATLRLSLRGAPKLFVEVQRSHFEKLRFLHARHSRRLAATESPSAPALGAIGAIGASVGSSGSCGSGTDARAAAASSAHFLRDVFCMLLRYEALGSHGSQCAVPPAVFELMRERLGVRLECFASPLNAWAERFCSAFADVDAPFGTLGSFFDFSPPHGSFEVNPPFVPELLLAAVHRAEALLAAAERRAAALSFVFVVPQWEPLPFWRHLMGSGWRRGPPLHLAADRHAFVDGAQHTKHDADRLRPSSFGSTIAVLQTARGAAKWVVDASLIEQLAARFEAALPSESSTRARMEKGGGDAVAQLLHRRCRSEAATTATIEEPLSEVPAPERKRKRAPAASEEVRRPEGQVEEVDQDQEQVVDGVCESEEPLRKRAAKTKIKKRAKRKHESGPVSAPS